MKCMHLSFIVCLISMMWLCGCELVEDEQLFCQDHNYQDSMYSYLKDEPDVGAGIEQMHAYFNACLAEGLKPAPGSYAHMGLLCSKNGDGANARKYFSKEKQQFPESATYMDFLMKSKRIKK